MNIKVLFRRVILSISLLVMNCVGNDHDRHIPIEDFFDKPDHTSFKISTNGKWIAYLGVEDNRKNIYKLNREQPDSSKQLAYQKSINVQYYFWTTDNSIVVSNAQSYQDSLHLYTVD